MCTMRDEVVGKVNKTKELIELLLSLWLKKVLWLEPSLAVDICLSC